MKNADRRRKFIQVLGTLICLAVLTFSGLGQAQDPFSEIPSTSWVYSGLLDLVSTDFVQTPSLLVPKVGEPILRVEAAMVVDNILRQLATKIAQPAVLPALGLGDAALRAYLTDLTKGASPDYVDTLFALVKELQPELGMLVTPQPKESTGIGERDPITLKASSSEDLIFVDIDAIPAAEPNLPVAGPVSPGQLSSLARQYFRDVLRIARAVDELIIPQDLALSSPVEIAHPYVALEEGLVAAEHLASASLAGWQRFEPGLFSTDGTLIQDPSTLYFLGVEANVLSGLTLGTLWIADQQLDSNFSNPDERSRVVKSLSGQFQLRPEFTIIGEYTQATDNKLAEDQVTPDDAAARIGAVFQLGEVQVGADVRGVGPGYAPLFEDNTLTPNSSGYGLLLRYKNLTFETTHEKIKPAIEGESKENRTSLQLNYSFAERTLLKAGYEFVDVDTVDPLQFDLREREEAATFGVDVSLGDNTKLEAGLKLGWQVDEATASVFDTKKASAGFEWRLPWEADLKLKADYDFSKDDDRSISTTVGLNYDFLDNASLLLGYQLINFGSETDEEETKAGAELSISF